MSIDFSDKGLGRLYVPDEGDKQYPLRALMAGVEKPEPTQRYYRIGPVLDQGNTSRCVAFSWYQRLVSAPVMQKNVPVPDEIYGLAKTFDEWPGEDYDGTSVRGGAKALQSLGLITEYHWSTTAEEVAHFVLTQGTVVFGTNWYSDMMLSPKGAIIAPSGRSAGGHAYLCIGYNRVRGLFRFVNSWGVDYCDKGRFWMTGESVARLLSEDGEACAATERA
jgi:C1A family cysteine protease